MANLFVMIALLFLSQFAWSWPCPQVDLTEKHPDFFERIGVHNQGNTGLCYAYSTSTIFSYWALSHGENRQYSPLSFAIYDANYTDINSAHTINGGLSHFVAREFMDNGYSCSKDRLEENIYRYFGHVGGERFVSAFLQLRYSSSNLGDIFPNLKERLEAIQNAYPTQIPAHLSRGSALARTTLRRGILRNNLMESIGRYFLTLISYDEAKYCHTCVVNDVRHTEFLRSVGEVLKADIIDNQVTDTALFAVIYDYLCDDSAVIAAGEFQFLGGAYSLHEQEGLATYFSQEDPQPVELTVCMNALTDSQFRQPDIDFNSNCPQHTVVVTGIRPSHADPNRCEIRIRNSWGLSTPGTYDASYELTQDGAWIPASSLLSNALTGFYLK